VDRPIGCRIEPQDHVFLGRAANMQVPDGGRSEVDRGAVEQDEA
jgi:hypothetical protein